MDRSRMKHHPNPFVMRKALKVARPCWPHLAVIVLLGLVSTPVTLLAPLPLKIAVDSVLGTRPLPTWLHVLPWPRDGLPQPTARW